MITFDCIFLKAKLFEERQLLEFIYQCILSFNANAKSYFKNYFRIKYIKSEIYCNITRFFINFNAKFHQNNQKIRRIS